MRAPHAIEMMGYGGPEVLAYRRVALAPLGPEEVRLKTLAAAVNHTDLKIRAGLWPIRKPAPFPYTPGVEVVGEVVEIGAAVRGFARGDRAITMMQGLGGVRAERAGGYADYVTLAQGALARLAPETDPLAIAALGLAAVTALEGLRRIGDLAGKDILITGAGGAVGAAGVALARAMGARAHPLGRGDALPRAVDGVLDTVGAPVFAAALRALRAGGVYVSLGAVGGSAVSLDLWDLIAPITLTGYSSESLDGPSLRRALAQIAARLADGSLHPPPYQCLPLAQAAQAHAGLESGALRGRVLLLP